MVEVDSMESLKNADGMVESMVSRHAVDPRSRCLSGSFTRRKLIACS